MEVDWRMDVRGWTVGRKKSKMSFPGLGQGKTMINSRVRAFEDYRWEPQDSSDQVTQALGPSMSL